MPEIITPFQTLGIVQAALRLDTPKDRTYAEGITTGTFDAELHALVRFWNPKIDEVEAKGRTERIKLRISERVLTVHLALKRENQTLKREAALLESRISQKPHELGTVGEIADRYGISKSQVRRLKAEGGTALADYLNTLTPKEHHG